MCHLPHAYACLGWRKGLSEEAADLVGVTADLRDVVN